MVVGAVFSSTASIDWTKGFEAINTPLVIQGGELGILEYFLSRFFLDPFVISFLLY